MDRYLQGDREAFRELYERYSARLMALMRRRVGNDADAQELVQQTFLNFHRARFNFKCGAQVRPWLYTIAMNLRLDHLRRQGRSATQVSIEAAPESGVEPVDFARVEELRRLRRAVEGLAPGTRSVIELHSFEGLGFSEVARILGLGLSAVKTRAHRGYKRLRAEMERKNDV